MKKISKATVDTNLRIEVFSDLELCAKPNYYLINDRQYGTILTDANGVERYVRIGVIVAEEREDMTARELMDMEIAKYNDTQTRKAEKAKAAAEKRAKDEARRKEKEQEKESE